MAKCPNCGQEIEEGQYMCEDCEAKLLIREETKPEEIAQPNEDEPIAPQEQFEPEPRQREKREPPKDTWDKLGDAWNDLTVGAQVAVISSIIGIIGFITFLFSLTQAGLKANISLWILIFPFVISFYLLLSSSEAKLKARIMTYSGVVALGALWLLPILTFRIHGLWWSLSLLGIIGIIGGGFMALWDATKSVEG